MSSFALYFVGAAFALNDPAALLRQRYQQSRWDEFFGLAVHIQETQKGTVEGERLKLLEVLALMRHCQWKKAAQLLETAEPSANAIALKTLLPLYSTLPNSESPEFVGEEAEIPRRWPITKPIWLKLPPQRLRRHIDPLCKAQVKR